MNKNGSVIYDRERARSFNDLGDEIPPSEEEERQLQAARSNQGTEESIEFVTRGKETITFRRKIPAKRGMIFDKHFNPRLRYDSALLEDGSFEPDGRDFKRVYAYTKPGFYLKIDFKEVFQETNEEKIIQYVRQRLDWINNTLYQNEQYAHLRVSLSESEIMNYFKAYRWLPMRVSNLLREREIAILGKAQKNRQVISGVEYYPIFMRTYPQSSVAGTLIGRLKKETGWYWKEDSVENRYLWPLMVGRAGIEAKFDDDLRGSHGVIEEVYDHSGHLLERKVTQAPKEGNSVVLSLDGDLQDIARKIVDRRSRIGAFVAIDLDPRDAYGNSLDHWEVLAMASSPSLDPNEFSTAISGRRYEEIFDLDPDQPFRSRAYQTAYPPASTYKLVTALAGLESGMIDEHTLYKCLSSWPETGQKNWTRSDHNKDFTAAEAIKRSCNTWFYAMANDLYDYRDEKGQSGLNYLYSVSEKLGLGKESSLGIGGEHPGFMWNIFSSLDVLEEVIARNKVESQSTTIKNYLRRGINSYVHRIDDVKNVFKEGLFQSPNGNVLMRRNDGSRSGLGPGEIANVSIGQGNLLASPLQMAQLSARIAKPYDQRDLTLYRYIVDGDGRQILRARPIVERKILEDIDPRNLEVIKKGMLAVTNGAQGGTGPRAAVDYMPVAGKTGSAQWGGGRTVGIFTGFAPANNPKFAFVAVYEGDPGEKINGRDVSGGHEAAPMVGEFLNHPEVRRIMQSYIIQRRAVPRAEAFPLEEIPREEPEVSEERRRILPLFRRNKESSQQRNGPIFRFRR